ncbi:NRAMP family divalent metal transporter [Dickeya chrysanthemi]|uniref:NRAMP family divalent metal transporter n=1 Tax=Dickeya chrysanthemi TaxID=556 RepID=A0ABU8JNP4_DICCH|nr:NRAMP family divalent metal transporter [Dickeya chrysanthemi]MBX9444909.1 divalent metal cation transporter [Dickeya chrysanthemi]MCA7007581.1 divalent metal cation transporter [Dickeya chrysanthemi]
MKPTNEPEAVLETRQSAGRPAINWSVILGAAFLMATSAIGPGFLTQTTVFTAQLGASFGFAILISILLDIGAQLNIWRVIAVSERRGQDIANLVLPGLGTVVALFILMGGLAFNIGNVAGAGLGLNVIFGLDPVTGAIISTVIAVGIFLSKEAGVAMDRFAQLAGVVMVVLTCYVAFSSHPPVAAAIVNTFVPEKIDAMAIITLVGGTVGGYITFAGGHRLLDAGISGKQALGQVTRSAVSGILITSVMRVVLFLAVLGVIYQGLAIDKTNPPASVFALAAGDVGYRIFGIVMWAAALTSVVGAAYTSVSFIRSFSPVIERNQKWIIIGFIVFSTLVFALVGRPVKILVLVGAINGLILPLALIPMLFAAYKTSIVGDYKHPAWMAVFGGLVALLMSGLGIYTLFTSIPTLFA